MGVPTLRAPTAIGPGLFGGFDYTYDDVIEERTLHQRVQQFRPKTFVRPAAEEEEEKALQLFGDIFFL